MHKMEKTMNFADRLKLLRQEEGISQEKLGEILNLGKSAVFSYEKQGRQPNFRTLIAMSPTLGYRLTTFWALPTYATAIPRKKPPCCRTPPGAPFSNTGTAVRKRKKRACTTFSASWPN